MKKGLLILLWFFIVPLASCDLDDGNVNFHFVPLQIVSAELPDSFELNQTYEINVTVLRPNACANFEGFDITKTATTERNVVAIGAQLDDKECAQVTEEMETMFTFVCLYSQDYIFRFWTGEDENGDPQFLEITVPVE